MAGKPIIDPRTGAHTGTRYPDKETRFRTWNPADFPGGTESEMGRANPHGYVYEMPVEPDEAPADRGPMQAGAALWRALTGPIQGAMEAAAEPDRDPLLRFIRRFF